MLRLAIRAVAIRTFRRHLLVNNDRFASDHACLLVTIITRNVRVPSLQRKMCLGLVIEDRRNPSLRIVAVRAPGLPGFRKLPCVRVFVAILANLRSAFELHLFRPGRHLVAIPAFHGAMRAQQRELRFGMVVAADVRPGPRIVASFTAQSCAVGTPLRHSVLKFSTMGVLVTADAGDVHEAERQGFILTPGCTGFVAIGARHGGMGARQSETRVAMFRDRESGTVEILHGVAAFTVVLVGRGRKLTVVRIFMAIQTRGVFHFVDRVFASGQMAFRALYLYMFSPQGITRSVVLLHTE